MTVQIELSQELTSLLECAASDRGISVEAYIQDAVNRALQIDHHSDPFISDDAVFSGDAPKDLAANHDVYLYGETN